MSFQTSSFGMQSISSNEQLLAVNAYSPRMGHCSYHQKRLIGCKEKGKKKLRLHQHEKKTLILSAVRTLPITQGKRI